MPLQATSGAASYDGFGGGAAAVPQYIEDVFSTYLYTGNGSTQTITNGIDLSTYGGLVWTKVRSTTYSHFLADTIRGAGSVLSTNNTNAADTGGNLYSGFNINGYGITTSYGSGTNGNGATFASWTFRKQPKFFDVVTWSGTGMSVAHSLGTTPATIILKRTNAVDDWYVVHRSANGFFSLNTTNAASGTSNAGIGTDTNTAWVAATSTTCNFENFGNAAGTYVAYLFAHNAGGFGLTGTDNVISCGSFTTDGSGAVSVDLGYEPQWILYKRSGESGDWQLSDSMRGLNQTQLVRLVPNTSGAETTFSDFRTLFPTATGFGISTGLGASKTYIYIAIRRGPMKVPTSGTSVFSPVAYTGNATDTTRSAGFPVDMLAILRRSNPFGDGDGNPRFMDRLRGGNSTSLISSSTAAEETSTNNTLYLDNSVGFKTTANNPGAPTGYYFNVSTNPYIAECFRRAPSFFDEVCYTGTGVARTVTHNLGVTPELMIFKTRNNGSDWITYAAPLGATKRLLLNGTNAAATDSFPFANTAPTSTVFTVGTSGDTNPSGLNQVAYLFATCPGVQYINSYVGDGTTGRTINCGFTGGARFVCIKATSTSGSWWLFDSARGIVTNSDPALQLNSTAAEITSADAIDTAASGFIVNQEATCSLNASGVTYLVWAIA